MTADPCLPGRMSAAPASTIVYDLFVTHAPGDARSVRWVCNTLRGVGLRVRTSALHEPPDADTSRQPLDAPDSRLAVSLLGPTDGMHASTSGSFGGRPWITMLAPGCRIDPAAVPEPGATVVDLREGLGARHQLRRLARAISCAAERADPNADPGRALGSAAMKRATIQSYDRIADAFAEQWCPYPPVAPLEKFLALLPRAARVLDAGCGPGHHASYLADRGHDVLGIDLSSRMLDIARGRDRRITFQRQDAQMLSFAPHTFDAVWCAAMPMHVSREEIVPFFSGLRRVLKPGGVVGVNLPLGAPSEIIDLPSDRRFFENYSNAHEVVDRLWRGGFVVIDEDRGQTNRVTHELDLVVTWLTLFARVRPTGPAVQPHNGARS